ncbi:hypothetical protein CNECB9_760022 [Cupriavidus necator]|uniref:Uncharacterized protein n=1 Tax=Cupriavidus necator TaxID=106590 RepID=A0A1K0JR02_CUPNE|nr:hypothetical protein CNECB9_760022 [Cupriavidus necator]
MAMRGAATMYRSVSRAAADMKACTDAGKRKQPGYVRTVECVYRQDREFSAMSVVAIHPPPPCPCHRACHGTAHANGRRP